MEESQQVPNQNPITSTPPIATYLTPQPSSTSKPPWMLISLIFILLGVASYFGYQNYQLHQQLVVKQPTPTATTIVDNNPTPTSDPTSNWQTYNNTKAGYSLKYPVSGWKALNTGVKLEEEAEQDTTNVSLIYQPDISKAAHELVFIITPTIPETDKNKFNKTKKVGVNYIADCWITEDNGYEFCWLKNTEKQGYLNINFNISKDENINSMIDQILSTFQFTK